MTIIGILAEVINNSDVVSTCICVTLFLGTSAHYCSSTSYYFTADKSHHSIAWVCLSGVDVPLEDRVFLKVVYARIATQISVLQ